MQFTGFTKEDFDAFTIEGLAPRMEAIRTRVQPKFMAIGDDLLDEVTILAEQEMHFHYAKHLRRSVNPPKDTWMAFCHNKRGYKQHPHFQVGLYDDHLFIWLVFIYEIPNKKTIATTLLQHVKEVEKIIPKTYQISFDHKKKVSKPFGYFKKGELKAELTRFRDVGQAEFLVGQHIEVDDPILRDPKALLNMILETYQTVMPIYHLALC